MALDKVKAIAAVIDREKGYSNNAADRGGETNWGITEAVARANGYEGKMIDMPRSFAEMIYSRRYIDEPGFDKVAIYDEEIANELIDTGVNMGPQKAAMFLQRCLNVFNGRGKRYSDLTVDGRVGSITLQAFKSFLDYRGEEGRQILLFCLNSIQTVRYIEIAEHDVTQEDFVYGQIKNRAFNPYAH